jgi:hypothetical protein
MKRVDEVAKYYAPAKKLDKLNSLLFWLSAFLSLISLCKLDLVSNNPSSFKVAYITIVIVYFLIGLVLNLQCLPTAESKRRKQLISDALGTFLLPDKTVNYYNNKYPASITRLAAIVMENSFFSKSIAEKMLINVRIFNLAYILAFLVLAINRDTDIDLLITTAQIIFSGSVVYKWLNLEILRFRHNSTYDSLYNFFLHGDINSTHSTAVVLDLFSQYETSKASASMILSTKLFESLNEKLSNDWDSIRKKLKMK